MEGKHIVHVLHAKCQHSDFTDCWRFARWLDCTPVSSRVIVVATCLLDIQAYLHTHCVGCSDIQCTCIRQLICDNEILGYILLTQFAKFRFWHSQRRSSVIIWTVLHLLLWIKITCFIGLCHKMAQCLQVPISQSWFIKQQNCVLLFLCVWPDHLIFLMFFQNSSRSVVVKRDLLVHLVSNF